MHPFDRSGLAALSDLQTAEWRQLYEIMERAQNEFLSREAEFRSAEYRWPRDPLHTWSRIWEYPYTYHHLREWRKSWVHERIPLVVDFGSGVTFFPFSVARLGCKVVCTDVDKVCQKDLLRAAELVNVGSGSVEFRLGQLTALPFEDAEIDALYSVSVLEHIADPVPIVLELARALKPGAPLFLTIDLDLRGDSDIGIEGLRRLKLALSEHFDCVVLDQTVHPADILSSDTGPFPLYVPRGLDLLLFHMRQSARRLIKGRKRVPAVPFRLAVAGFAFKKFNPAFAHRPGRAGVEIRIPGD